MNIQLKDNCNKGNYAKGRKSTIRYIVVHYTAGKNDTALNNINYFANNVTNTSAHYFVDQKEALRSVSEDDTAWHCGAQTYKHSECRNDNSIGVEMCTQYIGSWGIYQIDNETRMNAAELVAQLMLEYNIPIQNVLRHYDVTGKNCPAPYVSDGSQWASFKNLVSSKYKQLKAKEIDSPEKIVVRNVEYKDKKASYKAINKGGENYYRIKDICNLLGLDYEYIAKTKTTIILDKKGE